MDDANISSATSTSQISSLLLGQRLSSAAASISSSSSHASSFRGVPDDHWARQMVFSPFAGLRQPAASHLRPSPGGAAGTAAEGGGDVGTAVASLGFDPAALLQGGAEMCPAADFDPYDGESEVSAAVNCPFPHEETMKIIELTAGHSFLPCPFCRRAPRRRRSRGGRLLAPAPSAAGLLRSITSLRRCTLLPTSLQVPYGFPLVFFSAPPFSSVTMKSLVFLVP